MRWIISFANRKLKTLFEIKLEVESLDDESGLLFLLSIGGVGFPGDVPLHLSQPWGKNRSRLWAVGHIAAVSGNCRVVALSLKQRGGVISKMEIQKFGFCLVIILVWMVAGISCPLEDISSS